MRRRTWLGLGIVSAFALAAGGGAAVLVSEPGIQDGKLSATGRIVIAGSARGLLDHTMPHDATAISSLLDRVDALVANLPPHAQREFSQLLAILASPPGRRVFASLSAAWPEATVREIQRALQDMRLSPLLMRRQAYQALHDIVGAAYFSEPATWAVLSYPGPVAI
jgi:hypothetical protein